jgi:hypothetical protein
MIEKLQRVDDAASGLESAPNALRERYGPELGLMNRYFRRLGRAKPSKTASLRSPMSRPSTPSRCELMQAKRNCFTFVSESAQFRGVDARDKSPDQVRGRA